MSTLLEYPSPVPASEPSPRRGRVLMPVAIGMVLVLFIAMVGLLYYAWLTSPNPRAVIVLEGEAGYAGMEVTLESARHGTSTRQFDLRNGRATCRFLVAPGVHFVTLRRGQATTLLGSVELREMHSIHQPLPPLKPPATQPGAR